MIDIALKVEGRPRANEDDLISACLREERWAQKSLYEGYYGQLMGVCMRYANNREDARDILNEAFVKIFFNLTRYKPGTSLDAWMRRIVINCAIDFHRKHFRHQSEDIEHARHEAVDAENVVSNCSAEDILKVVQLLPPAQRTVFNLYAIEGFSHSEVANMLGISEGSSRSNLTKARVKLRSILMDNHNELM